MINVKKITDVGYDTWTYFMNKIPMATHFYYMNLDLMGPKQINLAPISQSGVVLSLLYAPFIDESELTINKIPYDLEHFGTVKENATSATDYAPECNVFKIMDYPNQAKKIGDFKRYPQITRASSKSWKNESKLYQFPYHYVSINDYINTPLKLLNHYLPENDTIDVNVRQPISITGGYNIFVDHYKGERNDGANEGMMASAGLDLPTSSSQYAQFMATSKASFIAQNEISERTETLGLRLSSQQMG